MNHKVSENAHPRLRLWYPNRYHELMDAATILRTVRHEARLTLRELARRAGTSHATLSAYEHGAKTPSVDTLDRVVRAAGYVFEGGLTRRIDADSRTGLARGDELAAVLELAAQFPARHDALLRAPVFGRP
jgi:transcriptional regulator with XRE-family HTH domain